MPDGSAFWTQYKKAEQLDAEVRAAVRARGAQEPGYRYRHDDPLRAISNDYDGEDAHAAAQALLGGAIDEVLTRHGLLQAITDQSQPQPQSQVLLLEA